MRFDVTDPDFCQAAERWLRSLDNATIADSRRVFAVSPGYYPTTLRALWCKELERRGLTTNVESILCNEATRLPVSHPLDCDWRFTDATAAELVRLTTEELEPGATVAHVGTPSTFVVGVDNYGGLQHVLVDRNQAMVAVLKGRVNGHHQVICLDLLETEASLRDAAAAILDPPWYVADTIAFLAAGSRLCREGAALWLCQPTVATRPGVRAERTVIEQELPGLGLEMVAAHEAAVRYRMPHFEAMSLRLAEALEGLPLDWRVGDLLRLRKVGPATPGVITGARESPVWREVRFGPVRIKLWASRASEDLVSLVPGDVLDTVSRRDPVRQLIGFWTSGNRVFGLSDPSNVGRLVELCHSDLVATRFTLARTLDHAAEIGLSDSTARRLFDVLLMELQEHTAFQESA